VNRSLNQEKMPTVGCRGGAWSLNTHHAFGTSIVNSGLGDFITTKICPASLLEFGSGTGDLASYIVCKLPHVHGCCIEPLVPAPPKLPITLEWLNVDILNKNDSRVPPGPYDLVLSIEVAEHIERNHHSFLFDFLAERASNWVVFSAARAGQGGHGHVAERPEKEWHDEWVSRGFYFCESLTEMARKMCNQRNINHRRNLMVFQRKSS